MAWLFSLVVQTLVAIALLAVFGGLTVVVWRGLRSLVLDAADPSQRRLWWRGDSWLAVLAMLLVGSIPVAYVYGTRLQRDHQRAFERRLVEQALPRGTSKATARAVLTGHGLDVQEAVADSARLNRLVATTRTSHGFPNPCRAAVVLSFDAQDRLAGYVLDLPCLGI